MEYSPKKLMELLNEHDFRFKKRFGQNFIIDENIIDAMIKKSNLEPNSLIIEIGPGSGVLTNKLATVAQNILCYEIDNTLKSVLENNLKNHNNIEIIYDDFLKRNVLADIEKYKYDKLYVVANLPYYITTPIITKIIEDKINVDKMIVMVQKEVGDRFRAIPGTRDYNSLTIFVNYYFNVKKIMDVSRHVFLPKPNVDSIVVEFSKKQNLLPLKNQEFFFKLVQDSFNQKRKTIRNNLKNYDLEKIENILKKHNFDLSSRAEQIPIEVFVELANSIVKEQ